MIFKCPGSQAFSQPRPEIIKCAFCGSDVEIWTDEASATCPNCKKTVMRKEAASCLDWCKYAKACVGEEAHKKYLKNKETAMLKGKMVESLNEQINKEIYSAYFYLGMAAYAGSIGLKGFENWFYIQWKEELGHAKRIFDYVTQSGARVILKAVDTPPQDFKSARDLFERTLAHEKKVTKLIANLAKLAKEENDQPTRDFLQWFVKEQVEEEESAAKVLGDMEKKEPSEVDKELAKRK